MAIVCPSRVTDVPPDSLRRGGRDILCHKFRAECERLPTALLTFPPPSPWLPPWQGLLPHTLRLNLVGSKGIVPALRWPDVLSPGEVGVEGEEGGGDVLVGKLAAWVGLGQATRRAISHRSAVDSARLKDRSQM